MLIKPSSPVKPLSPPPPQKNIMAPLRVEKIKGMSFSCASPSSAAICRSIEHRSVLQPLKARASNDVNTPHVNLRDPQRIKFRPSSKLDTHSQNARRKISDKASCTHFISPVDSSRYLLHSSRFRVNDTAAVGGFFDILPDPEPLPPLVPVERAKPHQRIRSNEVAVLRPSASTRRAEDQTVVLRVSLHCKGCEGKVRKHISKMQGVSSFSIDMPKKKVTVTGDVTPLGVLNSISKVKNAQFWSSPPRYSASF